jgi:tetratricopeptide (TPR) repeat protein
MPPAHQRVRAAHLALAALLVAHGAGAQTFQDPALESLYAADRYDELQRVAAARLASQPEDAQAVLGLGLAALARNDAPQRQAAIDKARACIERQPRAAPCQYTLGVVLGIQAMSEGLFKAARSAGTIRDALGAAHEIDPAWYPARSALLEFYAMAPGMMGGSLAKAAELARSAPRPEQARVLAGRVAAADKNFDGALQAFMAVPAALEPALAEDARSWAAQTVMGMVAAGQAAKAQPLAEKLFREHPGQAQSAYALARVRSEAGAHEEALKLYEQAATLKGAADLPIAYRAGIAQQQLGRLDAARASLRSFVAAGKGQKSSLEDARKRLEQLGG